jgi:hypothetical protein
MEYLARQPVRKRGWRVKPGKYAASAGKKRLHQLSDVRNAKDLPRRDPDWIDIVDDVFEGCEELIAMSLERSVLVKNNLTHCE